MRIRQLRVCRSTLHSSSQDLRGIAHGNGNGNGNGNGLGLGTGTGHELGFAARADRSPPRESWRVLGMGTTPETRGIPLTTQRRTYDSRDFSQALAHARLVETPRIVRGTPSGAGRV